VKIGVLSDSHDRVEAIEMAVTKFNEKNVKDVFHAGDIISPFTISYFRPLNAKLHIVWGNNDGDKLLLKERLNDINAIIYGYFMDVQLEDRRIAMIHGINETLIKALSKCKKYDLVIRGHTHKPEIIIDGKTLILNPGSTSGYLSKFKTVAIVDLKSMKAHIIEIDN